MAYERKDYAGAAAETTLSAGINGSVDSIGITASTGWPSGSNGPFVAVIDAGTASEEKVLVTTRTGTTLNSVTRGYDGTSAASHSSGATIAHCIAAKDLDEANYWVAELAGAAVAASDIIIADGNDSLSRIAKGSNSTVLQVSSGGTLQYGTVTSAMIADGTIATGDLADAAVTEAKIATSVAGAGLAGGGGTALSVNADNSTLEVATDTLQVKDAGITAAKIAAAVAGNGLTGGAGSALAVNPDGTTLEISGDAVRVKDGGISTAKIADEAVNEDKLAAYMVKFIENYAGYDSGILGWNSTTGRLYQGNGINAQDHLGLLGGYVGGTWTRSSKSINSASLTAIDWDAEARDSDGFCTPTSSTITIPTGYGGVYAITARVSHSWQNNGSLEYLQIVTTNAGTYSCEGDANNAVAKQLSLGITVPVLEGETITVSYLQGTGGAQNVTARIDLYWLCRII